MSFKIIDYSRNVKKHVGALPQVELDQFYDPWTSQSIWNIDYKEKICFDLLMPKFKINKSAKLTDILVSNHHQENASLLVSERLLNFLQKDFRLPRYQSFSTIVLDHNDQEILYHFLYFFEAHDEFIDFSKTWFYTTIKAGQSYQIREQQFHSLEDFIKGKSVLEKEDIRIKVLDLVLKEGIELDIFRTKYVSLPLFISDNLDIALEKVGISGLITTPYKDFFEMKKSKLLKMNWG